MKKILLTLIMLVSLTNAADVYTTFIVKADKDANLAFIASGIVNKIYVTVGSKVKKGEILAELQNSDIKAMLEVAKTTYKYAQKDYERQLKIKSLIDEAKFDAVANKYESAKNQLAYQQALYNKTFLKAPFTGVIYDKEIEIGDAVSGMMLRTAFKIQSGSKRKLLLSFDQKNRKLVKVGDLFQYKLDGDTKKYSAKISKVYPRANLQDRKINAEVKADNFLPGLFGDGYIHTQTQAKK
ncbi:HlyD family efflux transporter periplasmic adaptor subunit [Sulfurimonas sp.]|uniref:efflux RND transporter periplasmic adaptor subunit n=1 Tax=Sulfurimonas sp. TaxID=2022749 RepID=UPI002638D861|nr:HlyD family efflux transporter periplasmic adaptor subunit [Sulfurimonas sp.]